MKHLLGAFAAACLVFSVPAVAAPQAGPVAQPADAELAEAHAIIAIMFPPTERVRMIEQMQDNIMAQMRPLFPAKFMEDPGLNAIMTAYLAQVVTRQKALMQDHFPALLEAMAVAYMNEFSLGELKDIRAFAQSPSGSHYLTRSTAIIGDPAVAKVNTAMFRDAQDLSQAMLPDLKDKVMAYLKAHPEVAQRFVDEPEAKADK